MPSRQPKHPCKSDTCFQGCGCFETPRQATCTHTHSSAAGFGLAAFSTNTIAFCSPKRSPRRTPHFRPASSSLREQQSILHNRKKKRFSSPARLLLDYTRELPPSFFVTNPFLLQRRCDVSCYLGREICDIKSTTDPSRQTPTQPSGGSATTQPSLSPTKPLKLPHKPERPPAPSPRQVQKAPSLPVQQNPARYSRRLFRRWPGQGGAKTKNE